MVEPSFNREFTSVNNFRNRFMRMQSLREVFPELPEYIIYYALRKVENHFNNEKNKDKLIQAFLNEIFPILSKKITE